MKYGLSCCGSSATAGRPFAVGFLANFLPEEVFFRDVFLAFSVSDGGAADRARFFGGGDVGEGARLMV